MRTIAHLSDLHFGSEEPRLVEAILSDLGDLNPDLVVISGDLTQRARFRQFAAAADFLARITSSTLTVPGNHDVPMRTLIRRFLRPLASYRRFITDDLMPTWVDDELAVLGLNTARSNTWTNGRVSWAQMRRIRSVMCETPSHVFKILVTHHPFVPPPAQPRRALVGRGTHALNAAEECGVDLLLAGHFHLGYASDARLHYLKIRRSILVVQAGTALSCRTRGEPNAYNAILVDPPQLAITVRAWNGTRFAPLDTAHYAKRQDDWRALREPGAGDE